MFNLTGSEIVVILLLALVVLGPEKLPDAIRRFGRTYAELKKMSNGFQQEFRSALDEPMKEMRETADLLRKSADFHSAAPPQLREKPQSPGGPASIDATAANAADPVDVAPADALQTDAGQADAAPVDAAPVDAAPVDAAPADTMPGEDRPA